MTASRYGAFQDTKRRATLERHTKGQFYKNTVYLKRGMPYFAFVSTNAVLVRKRRRTFGAHRPKAPSGRELPTKSEYKFKVARAPSVTASPCHLPPGGRLCYRPTVHLKGVTHYTLRGKACEKGQRRKISVLL